ncbi:MAG: hypothetical protein RL722_88, partial [Pseudomonadota bacterium]
MKSDARAAPALTPATTRRLNPSRVPDLHTTLWRSGLTLLLGTLLAGCASRPARPDPLETPPLLVAVPGPSGVTTSLS